MKYNPMKSRETRQSFYDFFKKKNHHFIRSSPVIPLDDPTLLFINAGMNQFKPVFLEEVKPEFPRAYNSQKCIRVSGKHNDLEEVGVDTFHHTFFEMLGTWSFGDYYKKEAIKWAWEWFTTVLKLDRDRLWVTVYKDDDEAAGIWASETDIRPDRILRFGKKDNFWEMGETGPCGPCSEIHYYIGNDPEEQSSRGVNASDEYWELWNLVFIQYNRDEAGELNDLPSKHVDTGAGFERITAVLQGKKSNYDTDLFMPIIEKAVGLTDRNYEDDPVPFRVIADHIRMLCFSIADGGLPSNDGRGYVIRRILRRALRFGRMIGLKKPFLFELVDTVGVIMGDYFPEVREKGSHIKNVIRAEESSFNETLDRGLSHFEKVLKNLKGTKISGKDAFKLYDTYGFPLDLTQLMAREKGLDVDISGFDEAMNRQKEKARSAGNFRKKVSEFKWTMVNSASTEFKGYETSELHSKIGKYAVDGDKLLLVLVQTPFYGESGGQVGDTGTITGEGTDLKVLDTKKDGEDIVHICTGKFDVNRVGGEFLARVDQDRRQAVKMNHTATHLLHAALKKVLGDHVHQAGSLVSPNYLRFDLTHFEKIKREEIIELEQMVNAQILANTELDIKFSSFDEARADGAEALFGEKYGNTVRVLSIGDFSKELCGGTHVDRTGDIGSFKIVEESSLATGVRRIIAVTGRESLKRMQEQEKLVMRLQTLLNASGDVIFQRVEQLLDQKISLEKKLKQYAESAGDSDIEALINSGESIDETLVIIKEFETTNIDLLKQIGDILLEKGATILAVLGTSAGAKPKTVVVVSDDLVQKGIKAGKIAMELGKEMGAGGGGKPHLATCGARDQRSYRSGMAAARGIIVEKLNLLKD